MLDNEFFVVGLPCALQDVSQHPGFYPLRGRGPTQITTTKNVFKRRQDFRGGSKITYDFVITCEPRSSTYRKLHSDILMAEFQGHPLPCLPPRAFQVCGLCSSFSGVATAYGILCHTSSRSLAPELDPASQTPAWCYQRTGSPRCPFHFNCFHFPTSHVRETDK